MKLNRRQMLAGSAASLWLPRLAEAAAGAGGMQVIEPRAAEHQLAPSDYPATRIWGYDGMAPGPEMRIAQGERLTRRLRNGLDQPTSIHWHGIRIDNAMDGVPGLTQEAVAPGASFDYDFALPDAGTYWYHAHAQSVEQVGRGLYGALIVTEPEPLDIDAEHVLILDDWRLQDDAQLAGDWGAPHDNSHGGRMGNFIATNATFDLALPVEQNARLRLRLINAANARIFPLALKGLEGWIVALDGMPLASPEAVGEDFVLGPGQRADLLVDVVAEEGEEAYLVRFDRDAAAAQVSFPVTGRAALSRRPAPAPLPPNPGQELPDLASVRALDMPIEGGAMGRLGSAMYEGAETQFRDLVGAGQFWALGGAAGLPKTPFASAARGETLRIRMENQTVFPHAMHLHGMHFREVLSGGALGPMRDTLLVAGQETGEIVFEARNPGKWLIHCHMLGHAASGMVQWIEVT
ncbi:multicopper oxidase family protein [Profundibacterium mesophilum]|uniref:Copper resitance protein n=1 Tax=Profundibacterium mesophilum KAUST100406-0324 TaxID=1037889 RepID=A0A921NYD5_9RHOB|nr:multicopper oxidase family protein [Profundibacterium mesophilum]KAF0675758.1 Copper resitance protein [Profundibacterium mesophilum KAUST100406-0324]